MITSGSMIRRRGVRTGGLTCRGTEENTSKGKSVCVDGRK
jgi:hypothetical protein